MMSPTYSEGRTSRSRRVALFDAHNDFEITPHLPVFSITMLMVHSESAQSQTHVEEIGVSCDHAYRIRGTD